MIRIRFSSLLTALALALLLSPPPLYAETSELVLPDFSDYSDSVFSPQGDTSNLDLPDFGDSSGSVISPQMEQLIGEAFMRSVRKNSTILDDPEVEAYIRSLGYRLVANSANTAQSYTFFVVKDPMINAFAAPGGIIGVHSGVIINARSESELAAVMAHEIAHITQRHIARMFEAQQNLSLPSMAALIGSILLTIVNPQAGQAALTALAGAQAQFGINFTRSNEQEADSIGMKILARSGFSPGAMARFFERLQRSSRYYQGNAPEFLRTHPVTTSRIAEARGRAEDYPPIDPDETESFAYIRMKIIANSNNNEQASVTELREMLEDAEGEAVMPTRYGYVVALTRARQFAEAERQMQILLQHDNEKSTFLLAAARLAAEQQNYTKALEIYRHMQHLYPDYRPLVLAWANTLLDAGQPAEARNLLRNYGRNNPTDYQYYELLYQAESQSGNTIEGDIAQAEYLYLIGDTSLAIERLRQTQRQPGINYYQQQRIDARLAQYQEELELKRELEI